jgi:hypothetical protein
MLSSQNSSFFEDRINLGPKIREQCGRVAVTIGPDGSQPVPMIVHRVSASPFRPGGRMRIVEANQTITGSVVQSETVAQALRALRTGQNALDHEPDHVFAFCIDRKHFSIKVKQDIEARIAAIHQNYVIIR